MSEKRISMQQISKVFAVLLILNISCTTQKAAEVSESKSNLEMTIPENSKPENKKEAPAKTDGSIINATLNCSGSSAINTLLLSAKKYDTQDFTCSVRRSGGLTIQFISASKGMDITFQLSGVEDMHIQSSVYSCKSSNPEKNINVSLKSKSLGSHNFGDTFEGQLEILDYGMSSDVICGQFSVIDRKGNKIEGTFNEIISSF